MTSPQEIALDKLLAFIKDSVSTMFANPIPFAETTCLTDEARKSCESSFRSAAASLDNISTKFTVAYRGPPENPEECVPLAQMLEKAIGDLAVASVNQISRSSSPIRRRIEKIMRDLLVATTDLVVWFRNQKLETRSPAPIVAVVWEYCKQLREIRLDDKEAVSQQVMSWVAPIKDAIEELEEIEEIPEKGDDDDGDEKEDDEDEDDEEGGLTARELEVRPPIITLAKVACLVLKKASQVVESTRSPISFGQLEEFVRLSNMTSELADETVCSIYRPQDRSLVRSNATRFSDVISRVAQMTSELLVPFGDSASGDRKTLGLLIAKANDCLRTI